MARAEWTYQVAPAGAPSEGLEGYVVAAASGESVGKVQTVLGRDDELYVVVERGTPPFSHDVRAIPWGEIARIDHEALTVHLAFDEHALAQSLELDPDKGVETEDAEARRVTRLPADLTRPVATGDASGPVDRPTYALSLALGLVGVFSVLVLVIAATALDFTWHFALFLVPALLLVAAAVAGYRSFREPYERR
ncbi:MAG: hypothetical protein KY396_01290 [Actinobacteria bacterium]|nr:hypothetical protein [Actinomycetota bacterium]